jgi:uncharacterized membrane protein YbhN (UPF0104 family)
MNRDTARKLVVLGCKLAVTLTLLAVALCTVRVDTLTASLRGADAGLTAAAALLLVLGGFAGAASWFCVLRLRLPELRFRDTAACHWSGMFFNSFLPSNVGGDVVRGWLVSRLLPASPPREEHAQQSRGGLSHIMTCESKDRFGFIAVSLLLDRAVNLVMLLGIGGFALLFERQGPLPAFGALAGAAALTACLTAALHKWPNPRPPPTSVFRSLTSDLLALAGAPRRLFPLLLAAFASQFLKTGSNLFIVLALGLNIPLFCVWYVIPLFGLISALPVSIGGLGVRELAAHALAAPLRVDNTHLVTLSLAGHLLTVLVNLLGAIPFMSKRCRRAGGGS